MPPWTSFYQHTQTLDTNSNYDFNLDGGFVARMQGWSHQLDYARGLLRNFVSGPHPTATVSGLTPNQAYQYVIYQFNTYTASCGSACASYNGYNGLQVNRVAKPDTHQHKQYNAADTPTATGVAIARPDGTILFSFTRKSRHVHLSGMSISPALSLDGSKCVDGDLDNFCSALQLVNPPECDRTYSSVHLNDACGEHHAQSMLGSPQSWSSGSNTAGQWMRINAGSVVPVHGVRVQTRGTTHGFDDQYVTAFTVQYSADDSTWSDVDGGAIFTGASGNFDALFVSPVTAQYIRITVVTWHGHMSMRAGLLSGDPEASIALDLGTAVQVAYVAVYNRKDACCTSRLGDYTVSYRVRSTDAWTVCAGATAAADAVGPLLSECPQLAQYIRVQLPGSLIITYRAMCGHSLSSGSIASAGAVASAQIVHASVERTR